MRYYLTAFYNNLMLSYITILYLQMLYYTITFVSKKGWKKLKRT